MTIAEYMREIRRDNKRLLDTLRKTCEEADPNPQERYHRSQAGTLRWASDLIKKLGADRTPSHTTPSPSPTHRLSA